MNVNWKFTILAIVLIWMVSVVSGFVFMWANNLTGVLVGNAIIYLVGLTIVGCMIPEKRWVNITLVAAGLWVTGLLNVVMGFGSFSSWMWSIGAAAVLGPIWCYFAPRDCLHQGSSQARYTP
jgi:hypothetical protein